MTTPVRPNTGDSTRCFTCQIITPDWLSTACCRKVICLKCLAKHPTCEEGNR